MRRNSYLICLVILNSFQDPFKDIENEDAETSSA